MSDLLQQERYTFKDTARRVGVGLPTIWRWALHGARGRKLRSVHIGGRRYVLAADLAAFLTPAEELEPSGSTIPTKFLKRAEAAEKELEKLGL